MNTNAHTYMQERDQWHTTLTENYLDVSSDEDSAPATPLSLDLGVQDIASDISPATPPQLPMFDDLEIGM